MSLKRYLFYYMESINDDRDFHKLIVAPFRDTFCEGQMVETCCAEKMKKITESKSFRCLKRGHGE